MRKLKPLHAAILTVLSSGVWAQAGGIGDPTESNMEEIEVVGVRSADINARDNERNKDVFSSVIATDDVGNFTDQNVAESLRRLPGVSLQRVEGEGQFVSVRGLGPGFVTVSINGAEAAGAGDDREFSLAAIPSDMLGSIEVFKTLTPDMNLNSIGGAVNVNSVSALDRGKDSLKLKVQATSYDKRSDITPKVALTGTKLFKDETVGLGYTLSYEERNNRVDEVRAHSSGEMIFWEQDVGTPSGDVVLGPRQRELRQEDGDRKRLAGSLNLEFRDGGNYYYAKTDYTNYEDVDVARREFVDFQDAGSGEVGWANAATKEFVLSDVDVFQQYFIQENESERYALSLGGENILDNGYTIDYEVAYSKSEADKPDGRRVQFRETDLVVIGRGVKDDIYADVIDPAVGAALGGFYTSDWSSSDIAGVPDDLSRMHLDNIFLETSNRTDEVKSFEFNVRKDFEESSINYLKFGGVIRNRNRDNDKERWSYDPDDGTTGCNGDVDCLAVTNSYHSDYANEYLRGPGFMYPFITRGELERIIVQSKLTRDAATNGEVVLESTSSDYTLDEKTAAAYVMSEFQLSEKASLIAGVRFESTKVDSTGYFSIENDDFVFPGEASTLDIALPMIGAGDSYNDLFPSLHLRYEPNDQTLVRASLWTSFTRPSFNQMRTRAKIDDDIQLCNPTTGLCDDGATDGSPLSDYVVGPDNGMQIGNPNLTRMYSKNADLSIGWYPDDNLFLQAAVFYKQIDDFIVDVNGASYAVSDLPVALPIDQIDKFQFPASTVLSDVDLSINGDRAKLYGVELSYVQYFTNGFFIQSNVTIQDSDATLDDSIRRGFIKLPDQADTTINLTIGWENDKASVRVIGYQRSKILEQIGSCSASVDVNDPTKCKTWSDLYQDSVSSVDVKLQYEVSDNLQVYFDAINVTDEEDVRYFQGNELSDGPILYQKEMYGSSYQLGVNYKF